MLVSHLDNAVSARLKDVGLKHNVTGHSLFFYPLQYFIVEVFGPGEEFIVGIPAHGRTHPDVQQVQGLFVNNLPIRSVISGHLSFIDLLKHISGLISEAVDHQELAFDDLLNLLNTRSRPGRSPLFDTMFLYQSLRLNDRQSGSSYAARTFLTLDSPNSISLFKYLTKERIFNTPLNTRLNCLKMRPF